MAPKRKAEDDFTYKVQCIMHGFGDYDNVSNREQASMVERFLIDEWLPLYNLDSTLYHMEL